MPDPAARKAIADIQLRKYGKTGIDTAEVVQHMENFSGAEIEAAVVAAMFDAFSEGGRAPTTADIVVAAKKLTPLYDTMRDETEKLRKWAATRATPAASATSTLESHIEEISAPLGRLGRAAGRRTVKPTDDGDAN